VHQKWGKKGEMFQFLALSSLRSDVTVTGKRIKWNGGVGLSNYIALSEQ
jgi:hypothetical protein